MDRKNKKDETVRDTEHDRSAIVLGDDSTELPLAFLHSLLVLLTNIGVTLCHNLVDHWKTLGMENGVEKIDRDNWRWNKESLRVII